MTTRTLGAAAGHPSDAAPVTSMTSPQSTEMTFGEQAARCVISPRSFNWAPPSRGASPRPYPATAVPHEPPLPDFC
jgi:hypothetical protein